MQRIANEGSLENLFEFHVLALIANTATESHFHL